MKIEKIYLNEQDENVTLTTYILEDSTELLNGKKRPAILICPGGAYMFCSDREAEPIALRFAAMGYHAFVLRYSVFSNGGEMYPIPGKTPAYQKSVMPNPMREIGKAMLKIREHESEWLVDTKKIILTGYSAGANSCALYSVYWNQPVIFEYLGVDPEWIRPAGAILGYGVYDYPRMKESLEHLGDPMRVNMNRGFNLAFFGEADPEEALLEAASPVRLISEQTPPMFLWATKGDNVVPSSQTLAMALAMDEKGIPYEMHMFEEGEHGLSLADQSTAMAKTQIRPDVAVWMQLAEVWLNKRFALDLPEECPVWEPPV